MERQQQFWETLKQKYEEKNRTLQQREQELRLKLEAMDMIIGDSNRKTNESLTSTDTSNVPKMDAPLARLSPTKRPPSISSRTGTGSVIASQHLPPNIIPADYKSCTCPPPAEKTGLLNCIWSIFGSSKPKSSLPAQTTATPSASLSVPVPATTSAATGPSSPPAPQDVPTKDDIPPFEADKMKNDYTNYVVNKNENCMCDICIADIPIEPNLTLNVPKRSSKDYKNGEMVPKDSSSCNCQLPPFKANKIKDEKCMCDICMADLLTEPNVTSNAPKRNSKDLCPCNYVSQESSECICSLGSKSSSKTPLATNVIQRAAPTTDTGKGNTTGEISAQKRNMGLSNLSLKSVDLFYMKDIHDLATQQKDLLNQINALETKEKIYEDVFKEYKTVNFSTNKDTKCTCCKTTATDSDQKTNAELKLENFLLKNELKDMRLEVRQYLERMEGPMQFKIESERYKCFQLEQKLEEAAKELANLQEFYQKEINALKMELCTANTNIYNLTAHNTQLQENLELFKQKCSKLEDDLIRQKISEAETIKSLQDALNAQINANVVKDECDLHQIARELSKILKECEPCGDCITLPEDLTSAAKLLKNLTDLVDDKLNESEDMSGKAAPTHDADFAPKMGTIPEETSKIIDALEIVVTQELNAISPVKEDRDSQLKPEVQSIGNSPDEQKNQVGEEIAPLQPEFKSKNSSSEQLENNEPGQRDETFEKNTVKSETYQKSETEGDRNPERETESEPVTKPEADITAREGSVQSSTVKSDRRSESEQRSQKSDKEPLASVDAPNLQPVELPPKHKKSCKCLKSKKSTPVDQIWPKSDIPIVMKDSSLLETMVVSKEPSKKKCNCSIARKMREQAQSQISASKSSKKICKCDKRSQEQTQIKSSDIVKRDSKPTGDAMDQLWSTTSERFKLSHQVTTSKSKDFLKSETSVKCLKAKENFPFDIETQVDVINKPPDGVHVTTTITNSGTLEVITEGPEGVIETTLVYTNSGNVEVVTEILEFQGKGKLCKRRKPVPGLEMPDLKALEAPPDLKVSAADSRKLEEGISGVQVDSSKSGPMSPSCLCKECPGLQQMEREYGEEIKDKQETDEISEPQILQPEDQSKPKADETIRPETEKTTEQTSEPGPAEISKVPETTEPEGAVSVEPETAAEVQQPDISSKEAEDTATVTPEDAVVADVENVATVNTQETVEASVTEAPEVLQQISENPAVAKTLSLSLHVENEEDLAKLAESADN